MDWQEIKNELKEIKTTFDKSYKCMTPNREVQQDTLNKHAQILVRFFNKARQLIHRAVTDYLSSSADVCVFPIV